MITGREIPNHITYAVALANSLYGTIRQDTTEMHHVLESAIIKEMNLKVRNTIDGIDKKMPYP